MNTAFVNGAYCQLADAKISIFDRGFLFGDAVYEVLPVYNGQAYFVDRHLSRLRMSCEKIKIQMPDLDWVGMIEQLISRNEGLDVQIYIQVTRGNQGVRKHDIPKSLTPTVIAFTLHNPFPGPEDKEKGMSAKIVEDTRWLHCEIKATSLLANILLNDEAVSSGSQTAILVRNGLVTEGSTSNVFIVSDSGQVKTSPLDNLCLPGVTRMLTLELVAQLGWDLKEEAFSVDEMLRSPEVWITSTTKEIMPITHINDSIIGTGVPGNYWRIIDNLYQQLIK